MKPGTKDAHHIALWCMCHMTPLTLSLKSHVALANTWHCPIRWGIKWPYKLHSLGPTDLRNATLFSPLHFHPRIGPGHRVLCLSCLLSLVLSLSYTSWTQIPVTSRHARNISVSYLDPLLIINTWQHLSLDHSSVHYPPSANQVMYCVLCLFLNHLVLSSMKKNNSKLLHEEYVILSFKLVLVYRKFTLLEVLLLAS